MQYHDNSVLLVGLEFHSYSWYVLATSYKNKIEGCLSDTVKYLLEGNCKLQNQCKFYYLLNALLKWFFRTLWSVISVTILVLLKLDKLR
jgi:hypothetical protein